VRVDLHGISEKLKTANSGGSFEDAEDRGRGRGVHRALYLTYERPLEEKAFGEGAKY
jgi:hypothetical protein